MVKDSCRRWRVGEFVCFCTGITHENTSTLDACHVESLVSMVYLDCLAVVSTGIAKGD